MPKKRNNHYQPGAGQQAGPHGGGHQQQHVAEVGGGLGRAMINVQQRRRKGEAGRNHLADFFLDSEGHGRSSHLQSVVERNDLDEFLATSIAAQTHFQAERYPSHMVCFDDNKIILKNEPKVFSSQEEEDLMLAAAGDEFVVPIPRRPVNYETQTVMKKVKRRKRTSCKPVEEEDDEQQWEDCEEEEEEDKASEAEEEEEYEEVLEEVGLKSLSAAELAEVEKDAFLCWRRKLAFMEDEHDLVLTPFERNLDFWRQLWRVVELSDIVVQILDGRNPLLFRSPDLEDFVTTAGSHKRNVILINKADFLDLKTRQSWSDFFKAKGIEVVFFSALYELEKQAQQAKQVEVTEEASPAIMKTSDDHKLAKTSDDSALPPPQTEVEEEEKLPEPKGTEEAASSSSLVQADLVDDVATTDMMDAESLLSLFQRKMMLKNDEVQTNALKKKDDFFVVGLVGYPNVGKSSIINSLFGSKKVSISRQPGKTKHFQTLRLPALHLTLCDCPGLVFPSVVTTKFHLLIHGIIPIDHFRGQYLPAVQLICDRIPLQACGTYGISTQHAGLSDGKLDAQRFLKAFAENRKFFSGGGAGHLDFFRAARIVLRDYCTGKLVYCHLPPGVQHPPEEELALSSSSAYQIPTTADGCKKHDDAAVVPLEQSIGCDEMDETLKLFLQAESKLTCTAEKPRNMTKRRFRYMQKNDQRQTLGCLDSFDN
eukprot:GHVS01006221.1.p1 GENE.GHVS01006221.1~~GHVS01006221.1.p1  ORF type:complete len:708 (-),score=181.12 GHVS01006221.1:260-2383(-)